MKVLLLCAGYGTRLKPLTNTIPKCLVDICGKPLLAYWLQALENEAGIDQVIINTHYLAQMVEDFCNSGNWNLNLLLRHEKKILGTAGTLLGLISESYDADLMVIHADNLSIFDFKQFMQKFDSRPPGVLATMMTFDADQPQNCGIVELDSKGVLLRYYEKVKNPPGRLANAAVFIFSKEALDLFKDRAPLSADICADLIPFLIGKMNTYHNSIYHRDIGTPSSLNRAIRELPGVLRDGI